MEEDRDIEVRCLLEEAVRKLDEKDHFFEKVSRSTLLWWFDYQRGKEMTPTPSYNRSLWEEREEV